MSGYLETASIFLNCNASASQRSLWMSHAVEAGDMSSLHRATLQESTLIRLAVEADTLATPVPTVSDTCRTPQITLSVQVSSRWSTTTTTTPSSTAPQVCDHLLLCHVRERLPSPSERFSFSLDWLRPGNFLSASRLTKCSQIMARDLTGACLLLSMACSAEDHSIFSGFLHLGSQEWCPRHRWHEGGYTADNPLGFKH